MLYLCILAVVVCKGVERREGGRESRRGGEGGREGGRESRRGGERGREGGMVGEGEEVGREGRKEEARKKKRENENFRQCHNTVKISWSTNHFPSKLS